MTPTFKVKTRHSFSKKSVPLTSYSLSLFIVIGRTPTNLTAPIVFTYSTADTLGLRNRELFSITIVPYQNYFSTEIPDYSFVRDVPLEPITLPKFNTGYPPYNYTLTPNLPNGLTFDAESQILSGTPAFHTQPITFTYSATDSRGLQDKQLFSIEIISGVNTEYRDIPEDFAIRPNYPNPFHQSTNLQFDLPYSAEIEVDIFDLTGRLIYSYSPVKMLPGWSREIVVSGRGFPSGVYFYKLNVNSLNENLVYTGRFVKVH